MKNTIDNCIITGLAILHLRAGNRLRIGDESKHWVTTEGGSHLLIDGSGKIVAGAGGKLNGMTKADIKNRKTNEAGTKSRDVSKDLELSERLQKIAAEKFGGNQKDFRSKSNQMAKHFNAVNEMLGLSSGQENKLYKAGSTVGKTNTVKTAKGTKVETKFKVIDASELIASHDIYGNQNPNFPPELQPRDRSKGTSQQWVQKTAKGLDTSSLGFSTRADTGAPIVGEYNVVESGNGRSMAMLHAYNTGNANEYRQWLEGEAAELGIDPNAVKGMKQPILVRERVTDLDRRQFTKEANEDDKLSMSATEKALSDADKLDIAMVSKISGEGDLMSAENKDFIRSFLSTLSDSDAAQYYTKSGKLTRQIYDRVQSAVFAKAYNDDRLLELMADDSKPEIKNIISALNQAAPAFIQAKALSEDDHKKVSETITDGINLSLSEQTVKTLIEATNAIQQSKNKGLSLEDYLSQTSVFGTEGQVSEDAAAMAIFIKENNRSAAKMGEAFKTMADFIIKDIEARQTDSMFGEPEPLDLKTIIRAAGISVKEKKKTPDQPKQKTGGFVDVFTTTRGQEKDRQKFIRK